MILRLVARGDLALAALQPPDLERCRALMARYESLPMDFADATLVVLAENLKTRRVFTLDADFEVYRIGGRTSFEIIPEL
jgi:predicted nucleic acid-binding protein